jgi:coenzyme PQQ precursor peptide PqqA
MEANMMNYWTKPVFDEFNVGAECTAYADAQRAETVAGEQRAERSTTEQCDATSDRHLANGSTRPPRRDTSL